MLGILKGQLDFQTKRSSQGTKKTARNNHRRKNNTRNAKKPDETTPKALEKSNKKMLNQNTMKRATTNLTGETEKRENAGSNNAIFKQRSDHVTKVSSINR